MKKQIVRVSVFQSAKVMAALYVAMTIPLMLIGALFMSRLPGGGMGMFGGVMMLVLMPVLYGVFGFLFSLLGGWIYNMIASQIGGFEFTTEEVSGS